MIPVIYSEEFLQHLTGRFHPERPDRLRAIVQALEMAPWANQIDWREPTPVTVRPVMPFLEQIHAPDYISLVKGIAENGGGHIDPDTPVSPRSYDVALLAVSAWLDGVDRVLHSGEPAFVFVRPPGHHAEYATGMGFCLFSNAAIAAHYALEKGGIKRVGILDWDVHHGNGTQALVQGNSDIAFCSLHQSPGYPGTGSAAENGPYNNVLNVPVLPGSTVEEYRQAFEEKVIPFFQSFQPDLLLVSAGYDANSADPLAGVELQPQDFGVFTDYCLQLTRRIVFGLEGGYDLNALAQSVVATVERCLI